MAPHFQLSFLAGFLWPSVLADLRELSCEAADGTTPLPVAVPSMLQSSTAQQQQQQQRAHLLPKESALWRQAVKEAGLDPSNISKFGSSVPKFPKSIVDKVLRIKNEQQHKRHMYNFQGSVGYNRSWIPDTAKTRKWVFDVASQRFGNNDLLFISDAYKNPNYKPLGVFDRSPSKRNVAVRHGHHSKGSYGHEPIDLGGASIDWDYFAEVSASNFTICPGGDDTWSKRSYEVALAGSICLIRSPEKDWTFGNSAKAKEIKISNVYMQSLLDLYKYRSFDSPHIYDPAVVEENLRSFIKYQTFMEGDFTPPNL